MSLKIVEKNADILDDAIQAWREERRPGESLPAEARSRVLRSARDAAPMPRLAALFPAYRRVALAAVVPAGLLALILVAGLGGGSLVEDPTPVAISVEKVGNQVVFSIENGDTVHSVSKSNTPHSFDPRQAVLIQDGSYRDSMVGNGDLVFYRID